MKEEIVIIGYAISVFLTFVTIAFLTWRRGIFTAKELPIMGFLIFTPIVNIMAFVYVIGISLREKFDDMDDFVLWERKE